MMLLLSGCAASEEAKKTSDTLSQQGYALLELGRAQQAIPYFDEAIKQNSDNIRAYQGKGIALNELGKHTDAEVVYGRALSIDNTSIGIINNIGMSYILRRDYDGAIRLLEPHSRTEPVHAKVIENLALAYCLKGDESQARRLYKSRLPKKKIDDNIKFCKQFAPLRTLQ